MRAIRFRHPISLFDTPEQGVCMHLSLFGRKFSSQSGVVDLMTDLGDALTENPGIIFMGAGNPGRVKEVEAFFQQRLQEIASNKVDSHALFGIYQEPQGDREFRRKLADFLNKQCGWEVSEKNIAFSNGSQSAFFVLHNLFAGKMPEGGRRRIHFPLAPEYIGYADTGLIEDFFSATQPSIKLLDNHLFKYCVDFSRLCPSDEIGALCVSRPTNPTGNVLTDEEISKLDKIARDKEIPLIVDCAYGSPFPNIQFEKVTPHWNENTVLVLSLSKLGLPGVRTGIVVACEGIIEAYTNANTVVSLACGNLGPALTASLFETGKMSALTRNYVTPFYRDRSAQAVEWFHEALAGLPYRIHKPEGAIFLWLWFKDLPISSKELYERLKRRGVLIVPGHNFFIGLEDDWSHTHECIRVSYAQKGDAVRRGIILIAEEVKGAYG